MLHSSVSASGYFQDHIRFVFHVYTIIFQGAFLLKFAKLMIDFVYKINVPIAGITGIYCIHMIMVVGV